MTSFEIKDKLRRMTRYKNVFVPEFTWGNLRIDALIIDIGHRWVRGFEIKTRHQDFIKDRKWTEYSEFCSNLSIVCPEGLIMPEEVEKPFGLLWITEDKYGWAQWKKKAKNFQHRNSLSWFWIYVRILENELPRLDFEVQQLAERIKELTNKMVENKGGD